MPNPRAKITSLGRYVPPRVVTNDDLSKLVETNHDWIVERTGIHERHWVEPGTPSSELAVHAIDDCLKRRGIDYVMTCRAAPDWDFYRQRGGLVAQFAAGQVPGWLTPLGKSGDVELYRFNR